MEENSSFPLKHPTRIGDRPRTMYVVGLLALTLSSLVFVASQWTISTELTSVRSLPEEWISPLQDMEQAVTGADGSGRRKDKPEVAWLLSFPNSGTSYTLALTESASNRSIASNYGVEFTNKYYPVPLPVDPQYPEGPFWEGPESDLKFGSSVVPLPENFILTKTHCGGRCIECNASSYLPNASTFLDACKRTTFRQRDDSTQTARRQEGVINEKRVMRAIHLIRNPLHNVVSRFHLQARNWKKRNQGPGGNDKLIFPINATGFRQYCSHLDTSSILDAEFDYIWNTITEEWPASKS